MPAVTTDIQSVDAARSPEYMLIFYVSAKYVQICVCQRNHVDISTMKASY